MWPSDEAPLAAILKPGLTPLQLEEFHRLVEASEVEFGKLGGALSRANFSAASGRAPSESERAHRRPARLDRRHRERSEPVRPHVRHRKDDAATQVGRRQA